MYDKIKQYFQDNNLPKFRIKQFEDLIFKQFVSSFDDMTTFSKDLREQLNENFNLYSLSLIETEKTKDTIKFMFETEDGDHIESVLMINGKRRTACVSSQIFCAMGCKFCATGAKPFKRNLTGEEIVEQVLFISKYLKKMDERVSNVVYMGMGEPFMNYDNVVESIKIFNDRDKFDIGARHIVVSTCGIIPKIKEFMNLNLQVRLAISLHAANDELRSSLMPVNNQYPLKDLIEVCDEFTKKTNKKVSYEYVLIKGVNDSEKDAKELVQLLEGKLVHVNLIAYNPHEFADFEKPAKSTIINFKNILENNKIESSVRRSMGDEISGACGQLAGKK
ncbi:23S rRNA (adenine(2503)-C(2))-methyltransferase RlmN [Candidatus Woesearchaeota archaeon]|jgi:23S rRNA (adenine2503-C2)-methyltransferase|nr:23S rRNA (adenine(2503)-C(2))-methyltransferase RlmN [Candidatus Woesearchaeota archaeon]MBT4835037.1 23S rRNA (adenine(2503)-C(2))-methyltransferase RlmN [Candidatus Woesearchaeota archaeon]MBT6735344.1 23S rRNA (adenine(2503)-C(2))-methyltransferase RlmN [Candidatus Woesearchaeota archaeon]MBT7169678.1 23S rRNA (adenine(2503)-C(2))-methyltransferase RlmN [Candidatus Woesearchaeota archaeon]MBT7474896.1 23S rRNA (adenine(2503)-C(2))-methyltransferase RlmN [Candidatus Woesearchaeota archaeon